MSLMCRTDLQSRGRHRNDVFLFRVLLIQVDQLRQEFEEEIICTQLARTVHDWFQDHDAFESRQHHFFLIPGP